MSESDNSYVLNIVSYSEEDTINNGIFKFENCKHRDRNQIVKNSSCCSSAKVSGFLCQKKHKFPVSFKDDCATCDLYEIVE